MNASQAISIPFGWFRQKERRATEPSAPDARVAPATRPDPEPWSVRESGAQTASHAMFRMLGR